MPTSWKRILKISVKLAEKWPKFDLQYWKEPKTHFLYLFQQGPLTLLIQYSPLDSANFSFLAEVILLMVRSWRNFRSVNNIKRKILFCLQQADLLNYLLLLFAHSVAGQLRFHHKYSLVIFRRYILFAISVIAGFCTEEYCHVKFLLKLFAEMLDTRDFMKIINLCILLKFI